MFQADRSNNTYRSEKSPVLFGGALTMSTVEIAELTGKRHDNVLRDARKMLEELGELASLKFEASYKDASGKTNSCLNLPKRETLILVSGYSVELRARIIDRWQQLEEERERGTIAVPDFSDPAAAARAWADQYEARLLAERTKAEIGTRREATAMNTASQAVKKADKLEIQLDRSKQYASIKRMQMLYHGQEFSWRVLKHVSSEMGIEPIDIFDANYGTVKAYHADAWREAYALDIIVSSI